jgi:hypothetical protein
MFDDTDSSTGRHSVCGIDQMSPDRKMIGLKSSSPGKLLSACPRKAKLNLTPQSRCDCRSDCISPKAMAFHSMISYTNFRSVSTK